MKNKYQVTGMTCISCEAIIKSSLSQVDDLKEIKVSKTENLVEVTMDQDISIDILQRSLDPKYKLAPLESCCNSDVIQNTATNAFKWSDISVWKRASFNTLNCLIGCSIGDFGMVIFLQYFYPETSMAVQMVLAVIAGLMTSIGLETIILHQREKLVWDSAFKTAIGMSFLSMVGMEIAMNTTDFMITGGKIPMSNPNYWLAFIPSAIVGFLVPLPYNYYQLKKHNKACH